MRTLILRLSVVLSAVVVLACQSEPVPTLNSAIEIENNIINFEYAGGKANINFQIVNPAEGGKIEATTTAEWLSIESIGESSITIAATPNDDNEERTAMVIISYSNSKDGYPVKVTQSIAGFSFENLQVEPTSFTIDILPDNKRGIYILYLTTEAYLNQSNLHDDESLYTDDIEYFKYHASEQNISLEEYLNQNVAKRGDVIGYHSEYLSPDDKFMLYAYYIDIKSGERLSPISRYWFTLEEVELIDVTFDVTLKNNAPDVDITVDTHGYEGAYYLNFVDMDNYLAYFGDDSNIEHYVLSDWWTVLNVFSSRGEDPQKIVEEWCYWGSGTYRAKHLKADTAYIVYLYAIEEGTGYVISEPFITEFRTDPVPMSDLEIDYMVNELTPTTASITITPTIEDYTYGYILMPLRDWEYFASTDEERFEIYTQWYVVQTTMGVQTMLFEGLEPRTDYILITFGYSGLTRTTRLFRQGFQTRPAQ